MKKAILEKRAIVHLIAITFLLLLKPLPIIKEYSILFIIIPSIVEIAIIIYQYIAIPKIVVNNEKKNYLPNIWLITAITPIVSIFVGAFTYLLINLPNTSATILFLIMFSLTEILGITYVSKIIKKIQYFSNFETNNSTTN